MEIKRIRDLREDADLTQKELSQILNLNQRAYAYYESGKRSLPIDVLINIAEYFNTTTDYILGLTDNPDKPY